MILKSAYDEIPLSHSLGSGNLDYLTSTINHEGYNIISFRVERELDYLISLSLISKIDVKGIGKLLAALGFDKDLPNFIGSNDVYYRTNMGNSIIAFLQ